MSIHVSDAVANRGRGHGDGAMHLCFFAAGGNVECVDVKIVFVILFRLRHNVNGVRRWIDDGRGHDADGTREVEIFFVGRQINDILVALTALGL